MSSALVSTKLHIPRIRANRVVRPRLMEQLLSSLRCPGSFVLLSGPAGFGKTTLLSEFAVHLKQPVAWVSLDEADNDPIRFWTYLITACQSVQHEIGEAALALLQTPQVLPAETLPTILINDLVRLGTELVLVLDDYQTIQNQDIHTALFFLLDHLPDQLHLVISTRLDPPWPLARFRARDQLVEIRAADLRFNTEETTAFLNQVMDLKLSNDDVTALVARTEGWIASLQLAGISMKGRSDVTQFIRTFTGSHLFVAEYLLEEVLERQPEEVKSFLLRTSILERLNGSLCAAVSGLANSQALLRDLYQANLFVIPLDDEGLWFRYHHLFADLLRARLGQVFSTEEIQALHRRAAAWYEEADLTNEAIEQALAAHDDAHAVQLVEKTALPMIMKAYFKTVEDWLQRISPEYLNKSRRANMAFAWMHLLRRNFARATPHLERLQVLFAPEQGDEIEASLQGEWLALQAMLLITQGKVAESRELGAQALKILPEDETEIRSLIYMGLADASLQMLDYERATEACELIIRQSRTIGDLASEVFGLSYLGRMVLQQGRLHAAYEIAAQALQRLERTASFSPFSATLYGELAQVYYYWHQLEEARGYFSHSVQWSTLGGFSDAEIYHSVFLSRLFQMEGDLQASLQELEKALDLMRTAAPALVTEEVISQQVSIYLATDRLTAAQAALKAYGFTFEAGFSYPELAPDASIPHPTGLLYNSALRTLLYRAGRTGEQPALRYGIELAGLVMKGSLRCRHLPIALQTLLLRAQLHTACGDRKAGLADVAQALELAESESFISPFVEEGPVIAEALKTLLSRNFPTTIRTDYIQSILGAFPKTQTARQRPGRQSGPGPHTIGDAMPVDEFLDPVEPLTPREQEVLQYIAAGHSNQQIADKLVITLSAVKKHTGNIFNKLNVNSRTQAVARARQLGWLSRDE
ncbi:MAG TPA: LuxR C-terminal-related transcriptional regulator [Anaerolineales bacterium]|nr:LuxR C-terminal-related transcriptional regulator [Anaerolineales bacterium]